jgi:hypothetical protein
MSGRYGALLEMEQPAPKRVSEGEQVRRTPPPDGVSPTVKKKPMDTKIPQKSPPISKDAAAEPAPIRTSLNRQQAEIDKFEKYSTYLRPGYKKKLQFATLERDCADYEIIDEALTKYFDPTKK